MITCINANECICGIYIGIYPIDEHWVILADGIWEEYLLLAHIVQ